MLESIFNLQDVATAATDFNITIIPFLISIASALFLGILTSLVYIKTNNSKIHSRNFAVTLVMLPAVIAVIIILVGNNMARAFSLAGIFSITRFRSAPGNSKDISFVLFTMAIGLACGMGFIFYAFIVTVLLSAVMIILSLCGYGTGKSVVKLLKINVPEDLNYQNAFDSIFEKYTYSHNLIRVRTTELGSIYELSYEITVKNSDNEKDFIDEIRCRNGNLNITLVLGVGNDEY